MDKEVIPTEEDNNKGGELQGSLFEKTEIEKTNTVVTLLSYGGGQDSTAILYRIMLDPAYRKKYVTGKLLVVMSDTGNEHPATYKQIGIMKKLCKKHDIEFSFLTGKSGFHRSGWENGLKFIYRKRNVIGMIGGTQMCTDNLKIKPVDRFLEHWIIKNYEVKSNDKNISVAMLNFAGKYGRIRLLLGFAHGEGRDIKSGKLDPAWKRRIVDRVYPLVEDKWDREACHEYINSLPAEYPLPTPSNCMICFYSSKQELVWLDRFMPKEMAEWIELEAKL